MDTNARVGLMMTGGPERGMRLRITDVTSRLPILEVDLDGQALVELLSHTTVGGGDGIPAWITPLRNQIGKHHTHVSAMWRYAHQAADEELDAWAESMREQLGGEVANVGKHNQNRYSVVIRNYLTTQERAALWREAAQEVLNEQIVTAPAYAPATTD